MSSCLPLLPAPRSCLSLGPFRINSSRFSCFAERTSLVLAESECGGKEKGEKRPPRLGKVGAAPRTELEPEP